MGRGWNVEEGSCGILGQLVNFMGPTRFGRYCHGLLLIRWLLFLLNYLQPASS